MIAIVFFYCDYLDDEQSGYAAKRRRYSSTASSEESSNDDNDEAASPISVRDTESIHDRESIHDELPINVSDEDDAAYVRPRVTNPTENIYEALDIPYSAANGISDPSLGHIPPDAILPLVPDKSSSYNTIAMPLPNNGNNDADKKDILCGKEEDHSDDEKVDFHDDEIDSDVDGDDNTQKRTSIVVRFLFHTQNKTIVQFRFTLI